MKTKRSNYSADFKARVTLAAAKGDKTIARLSSQYKVHPTQITQWEKQLLESVTDIFSRNRQREKQNPQDKKDI